MNPTTMSRNQEILVHDSIVDDEDEETLGAWATAPPGNQDIHNDYCPGWDWALLPSDLLTLVFSTLEVLDLVSSGAVCKSWNTSYSEVQRLNLCLPDKSPCLLCDLVKKPVINEVVVYNIENDSFVDAPSFGSWMDCPPPIWIRPSFSKHK
nr:unnamed protein product [Digitaria exilis]